VALLQGGTAEIGALWQWLSPAERQRAQRFAFEQDRRRYIEGRARLREQLGLRLGVAPAEVEITVGRHGKPALGGRQARSRWRFNVSHCDAVALYAFAQAREVGVDVEAVRALQAADDAAVANFSPLEQRSYAALASGERAQGFFNCWTRKEAFVKALGCGLRMPLRHFDV
jgi:4'-phosphopantetheinyl transferase